MGYSDGHWRIQLKANQGTSVCFAHSANDEPTPPARLGCGDWQVYDVDKEWETQTMLLEPEDVVKEREAAAQREREREAVLRRLRRTDGDIKAAVNAWCSNRSAAEAQFGHI